MPSPQLNQYYRRRQWLINFLGGECAECGTTHDLEFDHIDRTTKSFAISERLSARLEILLEEAKKCQLLCGPCHKKKTEKELGKAEHGKYSMYRHHGCRCPECKEAAHQNYLRYKK